jgi:uncharacterized protein involved in outer membrane biogenesis
MKNSASRGWKRALIIAAAAAAGLVAAFLLFVPLCDFRRFGPRISEAVEEAAGLEVAFRGAIRVSLIKGLRVRFDDVWIEREAAPTPEDAPEKRGAVTARIKRVSARLLFLPLIRGTLRLDDVVVREPEVVIERGGPRAAERETSPGPEDRHPDVATKEPRSAGGFVVRNVRVERGLVTFLDAATGKTDLLSVNSLVVQSLFMENPGQIDLTGAFNERPLEIHGSFGPLSALLDREKAWPLSLVAGFEGATAALQGEVRNMEGLKGLQAIASAEGPSVSRILESAGLEVPGLDPEKDVGSFAFKAKLVETSGTLKLEELDLRLGDGDPVRLVVRGSIGDLWNMEGAALDFSAQIGNLRDVVGRRGGRGPLEGALAFSGSVKETGPKVYALHDLVLLIGKTRVVGGGEVSLAEGAPRATVELTSERVDVRGSLAAGPRDEPWAYALPDAGPAFVAFNAVAHRDRIAFERLRLRVGTEETAELFVGGAVADLLGLRGIDVRFAAWGTDASRLERYLGKPVPVRGPFMLTSRVRDTGRARFAADDLRLSLGKSRVAGSAEIDLSGEKPRLSLSVVYSELDLEPNLPEGALSPVMLRLTRELVPARVWLTLAFAGGKLAVDSLRVEAGRESAARYTIRGSVRELPAFRGIDLRFVALGADAAVIGELLGAGIPHTKSFYLSWALSDSAPGLYAVEDIKALFGGNELRGRAEVDLSGKPLRVDVEISSDLIAPDSFSGTADIGPDLSERLSRLEPWRLTVRLSASPGKLSAENIELFLGARSHGDVTVNASFDNVLELPRTDLAFTVRGDDLGALGEFTLKPLPLAGPFSLSGRLAAREAKRLTISDLELSTVSSDLGGSVELNLTGHRPRLSGEFTSKRLNLRPPKKTSSAMVSPAPGAPVPAPVNTKVFPTVPLSPDFLSRLDAAIVFEAGRILIPGLAIDEVAAEITLEDGFLEVRPFRCVVARGTVEGSLELRDLEKGAEAGVALRLEKLDLGALLDELGVERYAEGTAGAEIDVRGSGASVDELLGGLQGRVLVLDRDGVLSTAKIDRLGQTLGSQVVRLVAPGETRDGGSKINCFVSYFSILNGLAYCGATVIDTDVTKVIGAGTVDLRTERLDLSCRISAKKGGLGVKGLGRVNLSLGQLADTFKISGTLAKPALTINPSEVAVDVGKTAAGYALFGPIGLAASLVGVQAGQKDPCREAIETAEKGVEVSEKDIKKSKRQRRAGSGKSSP